MSGSAVGLATAWFRFAILALGVSVGLAACADFALNEPASGIVGGAEPGNVQRYEWPILAQVDRDPELLVVLAMSGGGKRSSSFSYGVLTGLRDFTIEIGGKTKRLLDEVVTLTR